MIANVIQGRFGAAAGCGFLSSREVDSVLEDRLGTERLRAFEGHRRTGCSDCVVLAADLEAFRTVATRGLLPSERREFDRTQAIVKAHLRQRLEALPVRRSFAASFARSWRPVAAAVAASAVVALLALPLLLHRGASGGPLAIGEARIDPMTFSRVEVRGAEGLDRLWRQAQSAYTANDWSAAERSLAQIVEREPDNHDATMYRGVALVMAGRSAEAMTVLEHARRIAGEQGLPDSSDGYWLGVAAFEQGDAARARQEFERVRAAGGPWSDRAATLLGELDRK